MLEESIRRILAVKKLAVVPEMLKADTGKTLSKYEYKKIITKKQIVEKYEYGNSFSR